MRRLSLIRIRLVAVGDFLYFYRPPAKLRAEPVLFEIFAATIEAA